MMAPDLRFMEDYGCQNENERDKLEKYVKKNF